MRCVDVNVLVHAFRKDAPGHAVSRIWLDDARRGPEPLGVPSVTASGFVRVVTHPRVFKEPSPPAEAIGFVDSLLEGPAVELIEPGRRHWPIFGELVSSMRLRGNDVPDAYLAAMAVEQGGTWVTSDHGFARFRSLRIVDPLAEPSG